MVMTTEEVGRKVLQQLNEAGYEAYFVGGMVRDALLGHEIYDADITTSATPDEVLALFEKTIATGLQHGTVTVVMDENNIEVTTFRLDGNYLDNRHPEHVTFTQSLSADLSRRDFTINAMAQALDGTIHDPFCGQADLEAKIIRAVGNPVQRFEEDALRILRGIRFVAKLGFEIEKKTLEAMKACHQLLASLSLERIRKEFEGIIEGEYRLKALKMMRNHELFSHIPYFKSFSHLSDSELERLDDFTLAVIIMEACCKRSDESFAKFPLKKSEKKLIREIDTVFLNFDDVGEARDMLTQYYFGAETLRMIKKFENCADCTRHADETFSPFSLAIESRNEIRIQPEEVLRLSGNAPGAWVNKLFTEIEKAIIFGEVENNSETLMTFIKERGIFDVKET